MNSYTSKAQWQSLYDDSELSRLRKVAINKLNEPGNQVYPGTKSAAKEIWNLCVGVADRIKQSPHTVIRSGRNFRGGYDGHAKFKIVDSSFSKQNITILKDSEEIQFTLSDFQELLDLYKYKVADYFNVTPQKGGGRDLVNLSHILPMCSLGVFQASGKNWIDIEQIKSRKGMPKDFENYYTGRMTSNSIGHASSLTGHFENKQEMIDIINLDDKMNNQISEIVDLLELRNNVILEGVPGTGKTWIRDKIRAKMNATLESTTFHPAKTYEEFVGGIFPQNEDDELHFNYLEGTVSKIANKAMNDASGGKYILFIDEINRANIPMVMGELLTIIESTKRTSPDGDNALKDESTDSTWEVAIHTEPNLTKYLRLPHNLYILATMNTSDRSVLSMDAALRRRFAYYRLETKLVHSCMSEMKDLLQKSDPETFWQNRNLFSQQELFEVMFGILADINQDILKKKIGPDSMLGHSYLFVSEDEVESLSDEEAVSEILQLSILPQIADILTSMNKTDSGIVNEINLALEPLTDLGASHYILKEPIDNENSLDIAVTVVKIVDSLNYPDPEQLFNDDVSIFRFSKEQQNVKRPSSIPEHTYLRYIGPGKKVQILAGSGIQPPTYLDGERNSDDRLLRTQWIEEGIIQISEDEHGIFIKNVLCSSPSMAGRIAFGVQQFQGTLFENKGEVRIDSLY